MKRAKNLAFILMKRGFLTVLLFLFFTSGIFGQEPVRDDRAWFDPYDEQNPLFYSDYAASLTAEEKGELEFIKMYDKNGAPEVKGIIWVVVNAGLYTSVTTEVDNYTDQLALEGYDISVYTSKGGFEIRGDGNGITKLKEQIQTFYIENKSSFKGCIFIGKLPCGWFQFNEDYERMYALDPTPEPPNPTPEPVPTPMRYGVKYVEFPCDMFFMDMDGTWEDNLGYINKKSDPEETSTLDGIFETHYAGTGNTAPEIWIARICANTLTGDTEVNFVKEYITDKNLPARNNYTISKHGALYYEDNTSTLKSIDLKNSLELIYGAENVIHATPPPESRASYFSDIVNNTKYEWIHIGVRSCSFYHHFGDDKAATDDMLDQSNLPLSNVGPKILDVIGSSVNRFVENNYIGGKYLFNDSNTILTVIGSTKSGGLTEHTNDICSDFSTGTIGDGYLKWLKTLQNENPVIGDYRRAAYGMTLLGDPTIRQKAQDGIEVNIQKGINFLLQDGQQLSNGSWSNNAAVTAFATLALLNSGYFYDSDLAEASEPGLIKGNWVVSKALKYLLDQIHEPTVIYNDDVYGDLSVSWINNPPGVSATMLTYYTSSAILPIAAAARNPTIDTEDRAELLDALELLRNFLIYGQMDDQCLQTMGSSSWRGGFGYLTYSARPDNSNTQFGIMGVRVANDTFRILGDGRQLDLWDPDDDPDTDDGSLNKCVDNWLETTRYDNPGASNNGQHGYTTPNDSYNPAMTAAALWSYAMCGYPTDGPEIKEDGYTPTDDDLLRSQHAADALSAIAYYLDSLGSFDGFSYAKTYYYTYTLAKALAMNRQDQIVLPTSEDIEWYPKMCDFLVNGNNFAGDNITTGQGADGSWPTKGLEGVHGGGILNVTGAKQLNTAWNINTLRIQKLPGEASENGPEDYILAFSLNSYSDLHVYDNEGRHVGKKQLTYTEIVDNEEVDKTIYFAEEQIPGSSFKIYEKDINGNFIREATYNEFKDGIIPEANPPGTYGYAQIVTVKNAQPDSLRIEIQGTSTGTFDLDVELAQGAEVIKSISYNDQPIIEDQVNHCYAKLVNIEGMEMYNDQLEESAVAWIDESLIREFFTPGTTNTVPITFEIKNLAKNVDMKNVSITCSNIRGSNGVIINAIEDIQFKNYTTTIPANSYTLVDCYITVPQNFEGPGEGEIKITSSNGNMKTRRIRVLTNHAPKADAGNDQVVYAGAATNFKATVLLDGSESKDQDEDDMTFKWYYGDKNGILLAEGPKPEITLPLGVHTIMLCVEDTQEEQDWDDVVISVLNRTPEAAAGEDITAYAGGYGLPEAKVVLDGTASTDPENDPLTYKWYEGGTQIAEGPTPEVTLAAGIHTISLIVDDTVNVSEPDEVTVTVVEAIQATMWVWPKRLYLRKSWGIFNTTIKLPTEIQREDVDDDVRIQLFTQDGESVTSFFDMIFPYKKKEYKDKKLENYIDRSMSKCPPYYKKMVTITSRFWKQQLVNILKETGTHTLYGVGRLKSGEYFVASVDITVYKSYYHYYFQHHYHYHHHHNPFHHNPFHHKPKKK
jgi:hypothetical protein